MEEGSRVQTHALQRLRNSVSPDEQSGSAHSVGSRRRRRRSQEAHAASVSLVVESCKEGSLCPLHGWPRPLHHRSPRVKRAKKKLLGQAMLGCDGFEARFNKIVIKTSERRRKLFFFSPFFFFCWRGRRIQGWFLRLAGTGQRWMMCCSGDGRRRRLRRSERVREEGCARRPGGGAGEWTGGESWAGPLVGFVFFSFATFVRFGDGCEGPFLLKEREGEWGRGGWGAARGRVERECGGW